MISPIPRILSLSHRHRAVVVAAAVCLAALAGWGLRGLRFDADVLSLLPRGGRVVPAFRTFVAAFGNVDDVYVILTAPEGQTIDDYDDVVEAYAAKLRGVPGITRVDTSLADPSRDLAWLGDRRLLLLSGDRLDRALARFEPQEMRRVLATRRELLALPSPEVAELVRHDPLGLFDLMRDEVGSASGGLNPSSGGYVSADRRRRLIVAKPERPPFDAGFSGKLMTAVTSIQADGGDRPALDVQIAGGHRIAVETAALIRRETIINAFGSLGLILPLLFIVFRSAWLVVVGSIPSALSLVLTLGALGLAGTTLSTAATASSALLVGLGIDGVVLLYVAHTLALRQGLTPAAAIASLGGPAASMLLGMWTTAATFYGLRFVDFPSLEQLGTLIGHSMVLCGILTLVLVATFLPRRPPAKAARSLSMPRFARWMDARSREILVAATIVTLVLGLVALRLRVNPTLDRLKPVTPGARLLDEIGAIFNLPADLYVIVTEGQDLEALLRANERLAAEVRRTLPGLALQGLSALLPSAEGQSDRRAAIAASGITAAAAIDTLDRAEAAEGFTKGSFAPFRSRLPILLEPPQPLSYDGYVSHGLGDLLDRFVKRRGDRWILATYAFPADSASLAALEAHLTAIDPQAVLTGLPLVNRELALRFLPEFTRGLAIGTAIVVALVFLAFRTWRLSALALVPTAVGLIWAAGLLAAAGLTLDLFALFAVVTFVGIGVDYGVHVVHRCRERGDARQAIEELAPVILVAAAITLLGYGTLVTSSYPPLRSIGLVSAVSIVALAAASLFVLPALLTRAARGGTA